MKRLILLVIGLLLFTQLASAATLFGTVYDLSLEQAKNVRVSINTVPEQKIIAVNGRYSFNVGPGTYVLTAEQQEGERIIGQVKEDVIVAEDGAFIHDLILEPYVEEEENLVASMDTLEINIGQIDEPQRMNYAFIVILIAVVVLVGFLAYRVNKTLKALHSEIRAAEKTVTEQKSVEEKSTDESKKSDDAPLADDLQKIIELLKSQQGRTTQKEIRKQLPQSEAKISLMIAELEKKGLVKKIKKGRGNIIILNGQTDAPINESSK